MKTQPIEARIYLDTETPTVSPEIALHGLEIVRDIAPWIRVHKEIGSISLGKQEYVNTDRQYWPRFDADITVVLSERRLVDDKDLKQDGSLNLRKLSRGVQHIGWAYHAHRAGSNRVALIQANSITRAENIVAHEVGHLLGVEQQHATGHCLCMNCVMNAFLPEHGRATRTFCDKDAELLYTNADRLRMYKSGRLALAANAKIF